MNQRQRTNEEDRDPAAPGAPDTSGFGDALGAQASALVAAARAAIDRAKRQHSAQYLSENRQSGGQ